MGLGRANSEIEGLRRELDSVREAKHELEDRHDTAAVAASRGARGFITVIASSTSGEQN